MRWSLIIPLLAAIATPAIARADAEADAKAAYAKGRAYFKAGQYPEAVAELRKAYTLKPHPALLRYMGDTYYKMNKARLAIDHYKKYLQEAPEAPDKDKIEAKVKQLELIVGDEPSGGSTVPVPVPAPLPSAGGTPAPTPTPTPSGTKIDAPTGEDREVPVALKRKNFTPTAEQQPEAGPKTGAATVLKWTFLGVGVAGLAMGIVFNRLSASKAKQLEDAVLGECPTSNPNCGGNPDMNKPVVPFSKDHYDLQQSSKTYRTASIASFVAGSVLTATSVVLFIVDRGKPERRPGGTRAVWAPMVGGGTYGLAGEVSF